MEYLAGHHLKFQEHYFFIFKSIIMEAEKILQADLLDILFENRNKTYGAYTLRRDYSNRLYKALGLIFSGILLLSLLIASTEKKKKFLTVPSIETVLYKLTTPPKESPKPEMPKQLKPEIKKSNSQLFVSKLKIIDSNEVSTRLSKNLDSSLISNVNQIGIIGVTPLIKCPTCNVDSNFLNPKDITGPDKKMPRLTAEVMPAFPGGMDALRKFLERNLNNPAELNPGEIVVVKVQFIVGFDGKLKGFTVTEDGGEVFNEEVIRVLKKMPQWIPGKSQGENVSVYYSIPVKFIAQEQ